MKAGLFIAVVFIVGVVVGLRIMHQYGDCGSGKPIFRGASFFEQYGKKPLSAGQKKTSNLSSG